MSPKRGEEETKAKQSAEDVKAVLDYFQSKMLSAGRPENQEGGLGIDVTLRQAVDAAEPAIAEAFADRPLVEASIRDTLGTTYWYLGEWASAIRQHERALASREAKLGSDHPDTLGSRNNLARAYLSAGRTAEAIRLHEQNLKQFESMLGTVHPDTLTARTNLAQAYDRAGEFAKSEPLYRAGLDWSRKLLGSKHARTAVQMAVLGHNLLHQGKYADAEPLLRDSLQVREAKQPDAWTTFNTRSLLGEALLGQKKYADAEPLLLSGYQGMKERDKTISAEGKFRVTEALERLVQLYEATGKKDEADKWRKQLDEAKKAAAREGSKK